jgi:hypothetical protein
MSELIVLRSCDRLAVHYDPSVESDAVFTLPRNRKSLTVMQAEYTKT